MDYLTQRKQVLNLCIKSDENLDMMEDMILKDRIWKIETKIKNMKNRENIEKKSNEDTQTYLTFNVNHLIRI